MKYFIIELIKFFKKNIIKILLGSIVFAILFLLLDYVTLDDSTDTNEQRISGEQTSEILEDAPPASFQFFVERGDEGAVYTNNILIEQYLTLPRVLSDAAESTDTEVDQIIDETDNVSMANLGNSNNLKVVGVRRDTSSHLHTFYVNIGVESGNLEIANFYYDYIMNDNIPFLEDKNIFTFKEPYIVQENGTEEEESLPVVEGERESNEFQLFKTISVGLVIGAPLTVFLLILLSFFSKKLDIFFFYTILDEDYFVLVDNKVDYQDEVTNILTHPDKSRRIILQEESLTANNRDFEMLLEKEIANENVSETSSILHIDKPETINRLIYIVKEGETTRKWYNTQRKLEKVYNVPTVVIQVNEA